MRIITLILSFVILLSTSFGQKINYSVPDGYEKDINKEDYKKIVDLSVPIVAKRYTIDFVKNGTIQLVKGQEMQAFNLNNLVLKCIADNDRSNWVRIIETHFDNMFASFDEQKKIDPKNYETTKKYLSLRIYPAESINQRGGISALITRTDLDGTYTLLMVDLPGTFSPVSKQMFDLWGKDTSEVFKIATANINKQRIEKVTKTFDLDSAKVEISFLGNEDYAASYALDLLNNSPDLVGAWGSAVVMPNKGLVDVCKIGPENPLDFVKFIQLTKPMISKSYQEHPQRISDQYFWYYEGKFKKIVVLTDANGNITVISPFGLTGLMTEKK